jgi:hypothetical protein
LTYTLAIRNSGPSAATAVTVTDVLHSGVIWSQAAGSGWTCGHAKGVVTCAWPTLAVGAAPNILVAVLAPTSPGTMTNTASIRSATVDPDLHDNVANESTRVEAGVSYQSFLPLVRRP